LQHDERQRNCPLRAQGNGRLFSGIWTGKNPAPFNNMVISSVENAVARAGACTGSPGNQTQAAQLLGLNRNTLRKKMKE